MANAPADRRSLLKGEGSDLSDASTATSSDIFPHQRHGYREMDSQASVDYSDPAPQYSSPIPSITTFEAAERERHGLGITQQGMLVPTAALESQTSLSPQHTSNPYSSRPAMRDSPHTPGSSRQLLSPKFTRFDSANSIYDSERYGEIRDTSGDVSDKSKAGQTFEDGLDIAVGQLGQGGGSFRNEHDSTKLLDSCPPVRDLHTPRTKWLSISTLLLSVYSTGFSGIWLLIALAQPRWGRAIRSGGSFTPATASILFTLLAKTIELSFVTVFVTFLGQVLSRRSLVKASRGVTIAELTLRTWVIQPGFMITHFQYLKHAALSFLGIITLTAALISITYTTASDALVSPHLRFGTWDHMVMQGLVKTSYANPFYIEKNCQTPITPAIDANASETTCLDVENAGQAYHNAIGFLGTWAQVSQKGEGASSDLAFRPNATGILFDNTTVIGSWVAANSSNMTASYKQYSRVVNNATLVMPHPGVIAAAKDPKNGIVQPAELEGVGEYSLRASVISPAVNVLCANVNEAEIAPLIYVTWPNAATTTSKDNPSQKLAPGDYFNDIQLLPGEAYLNSTVVDDIFEWGPKYGRQPPVFPMLPIAWNSIANVTMPYSDAIYMLIKAADTITSNYTLCELRSFLYPACSTFYNISSLSGANLQSFCDDPSDKLRYDKSVTDPPISRDFDWKSVGWDWMLSLSLNTGISNANSSTSRMLASLVPADSGAGIARLNPLLPSIAETLAVMAGNTLLLSTIDANFYHFWSYLATELDPGEYQPFNASITSQQYTSGVSQRWQGIFYIVLFLVFITNVFCLVYFFARAGLVTDYSEPQNLFAIAVNSPPSNRMSGSCGAGPEGDQLNAAWHVKQEVASGHFFIQEKSGGVPVDGFEMRRRHQHLNSKSSYSVLSSKRGSLL